jgi:lysophospholipase L1-like esterase
VTVAVPTVTQLSVAAPRITLQSATGRPVGVSGKWDISSDALSLADAGPILRDAKTVVILGDSYSSGEGTFDYLTGDATARESCHRSLLTYGLMLFDDDGKLTDDDGDAIVACSGAVAQDYFQVNSPGSRDAVSPQGEQLGTLLAANGEVPDVALMTFGGNDIGFAGVVAACAGDRDCTTFPYQENSKDPQRRLVDVKNEQADAMVGPLTTLYVAVASRLNTDQARAKRGGAWAPLVVLPYPQVLAPNQSCSNFTAKEREFGIDLGNRLNYSISEAVNAAAQQGLPVYYAADVTEAVLPDHTACAGDGQRWINPVSISAALTGNKVELMHPNARGYAAMTTALVQWSQSAEQLRGPFRLPPDAIGLDASWLGQIGSSLNQLTVPDDAEDIDLSAPSSDIYHQAAPEQPLHVTADGFAPNSEVRVVMNSTPRTLGVRTADDQGRLDAVVAVPFDADRGNHTLVVEGFDADGTPVVLSAPFAVVTPIAWWVWGIIGLSAVALAVGGALIWRSR